VERLVSRRNASLDGFPLSRTHTIRGGAGITTGRENSVTSVISAGGLGSHGNRRFPARLAPSRGRVLIPCFGPTATRLSDTETEEKARFCGWGYGGYFGK
jgi:hypothetical protein